MLLTYNNNSTLKLRIEAPPSIPPTWLLSVQVSLTLSLYPGPDVYVGPGFNSKFYGNTVHSL